MKNSINARRGKYEIARKIRKNVNTLLLKIKKVGKDWRKI